MSFKLNLFKECKKKYRDKLITKFFAKYNKLHPKNLSLNGMTLALSFVKINDQQQINNYVKPCTFDLYNVCFLVTWISKFNTNDFIAPVDLVLCDLSWKVIEVYKSLPNNIELNLQQNSHLYIMSHNSINYFEIQVNDYLKPF